MGSSLGPVLANIIMTELEETIIQQLIENDVIKFSITSRFMDS